MFKFKILILCTFISDLSWNCIGEIGAALLLKSLKNNVTLIDLNIQGNSVSMEMSTMIGMIQIKVMIIIFKISK